MNELEKGRRFDLPKTNYMQKYVYVQYIHFANEKGHSCHQILKEFFKTPALP